MQEKEQFKLEIQKLEQKYEAVNKKRGDIIAQQSSIMQKLKQIISQAK